MRAWRSGPPGERLFLRLAGEAAGLAPARPLLVCLHGFTGSGRTWSPFGRRFAARFRPVYADALGHGRSDAPERAAAYSLWRTADTLAAALAGVDEGPVHVLGYSMGGRQALHLALSHPERVASLVLVGASPGIGSEDERQKRRASDEVLAALLEREGIGPFVARWEALPLFASQARLGEASRLRQRRERLSQRPAGLAMSLRGAGAGAQDDLSPRLGEIAVPLLYVAGALDGRYLAVGERVVRSVRRGRLVRIEGAGHAAQLERPRAFAAALDAFWQEIGAGAPP